jgi:hypothetical protein
MKTLLLLLLFAVLAGCNKSDKPADPKANPSALETAAADFKARVEALKTAKIENGVFAEVRHDVIRTNSITSPLKAQVWVKRIVRHDSGPTIDDVTIYASYQEGEWHYDRCEGKMRTGNEVIDWDENSTAIHSAYDFIKALRLKHDDELHFPQFK